MVDFHLEPLSPFAFPNPAPLRVAPVRFARAVSGFSDATAPDVDDHGFTVASSFGPARGPTVGVIKDRTIRVKVVRDRISTDADLFAVSEDPSIAAVDFPAAGDCLDSDDTPAAPDGSAPARVGDCVYIRGTSTASSTAETIVKLHYGSEGGPVLAELGVRVYPLLTVEVQAHAVSINGTAPTTTHAGVVSMFRRVNQIYAQAGVEFLVRGSYPVESVNGFAAAGTVTLTNVADEQNVELQTVLNQRPVARVLNMYVFAHYNDTASGLLDNVLGIAFSRDRARANPANPVTGFPGCSPGFTMRDSGDPLEEAHTAAHEIGHALTLEHYNGGNGTAGQLSDMRHDLWAHRSLMHNIVGLSANQAGGRYRTSRARIIVGYGNLAGGVPLTGQLLMNKRRPGVFQSDQVNLVRRAVLARSYAPL